jgi:hypothetical protein
MRIHVAALFLGLALAAGCTGSGGHDAGASAFADAGAPAAAATPSDDPADWFVDTTRTYDPVVSPPSFVVPSPALPPGVVPDASNNNVALGFHEGRLFFAWRTGPTHFASTATRMYVVSSRDLGQSWDFELEIAMGCDVREPSLISCGGTLVFHFFSGGTNTLAFEPQHVWQCVRIGPAQWTAPAMVLDPGEIPWDVKVRGGRAWMTSYIGNHYRTGPSEIDVRFRSSIDGIQWTPVDPVHFAIYQGGLSEVAFEFDEAGALWAIGRNEDGDQTGWGAQFATASPGGIGWAWAPQSDPERYDSPRMIRHGTDLYLIARRDIGGPYAKASPSLPIDAQRYYNMAAYSLRPKRTALYSIDRANRKVVWILDLPSNGDTAFPAVARLDAHTFLVANYTSPLGNPDRTWIDGQTRADGTQIYLLTIAFVPRP